jgi:hypothetical protein
LRSTGSDQPDINESSSSESPQSLPCALRDSASAVGNL